MAATFAVRSGASFRANVEYRNPPEAPSTDPLTGTLIDTTNLTARLQIRSGSSNRRVLLSAVESDSPSAVLALDPDEEDGGRWNIFLPASITRTLPPVSYLEVELVSNTNPDDVTALFSGAIHVSPEQVY